jgi:hypothetical protein
MPRTTPPHGTRNRYQWRADPCRCRRCRRANTAYRMAWYHRRRQPVQLRLPAELLPRERVS